jgi:LacI family transcriptional regulator
VCVDEKKVAELALRHLRSRGLEHVTTFRFDDSPFAAVRDGVFREGAARAGVRFAVPWWNDCAEPSRRQEHAAAITSWLRALPRPCGIFTCCDSWGRVVARYARAAGLRVPEDLALVGVDNDTVECELITPPLSSVAIPWRRLGEEAAALVHQALVRGSVAAKRVVVPPVDVVIRRSSDGIAIDDPLVARAVAWIRAHSVGRVAVPTLARAVASSRQRLERRFRASLGRTVQEEVRRARVETAKQLLRTTDLSLAEVARNSGFTSPALLSVACQREIGMPPGAYRRSMNAAVSDAGEEPVRAGRSR